MPTSSRLLTDRPARLPRQSSATITLTDTDDVARTIIVGTIAFVDRGPDGGSIVVFSDGGQEWFKEAPDEVSRRIDEASGLPGTMPTHNHGRTIPAHRLGWKE
ncbi:MAG: hypothetical protein QM699_08225 [Amaricoccus sp.]|uniref:hypothetical protein n=1 Tax=Amaricoccus sp. TaxID=1872485 RepID=UPI0039E24E07